MKRSNYLLFGVLIFFALLSFGCAGIQANPIDPKAPVISLNGLEPDPLSMKSGYAVLRYGQSYRLIARVDKKTAPVVRVYRRLNYSVNNGPWWTTNFNPIQLTGSDCCGTVWTAWYWGPENTKQTNADWKVELEMWVIDADGRESNHLTAPVVIHIPY